MSLKRLQAAFFAALVTTAALGYAQQQTTTGTPEPTVQQDQKADLKADEMQAKQNEKAAKAQAKASKAQAKSDKAQRKAMKENEKAAQTSADSQATHGTPQMPPPAQ
jgi:hypothetical protein